MADTKLKPCPFCGSKNVEIFEPVNSIHIKQLQGGKIGRTIICNDCDVRISFPQAYDDAHAAEFWNGRKFEAEPVRYGQLVNSDNNPDYYRFTCCGAKVDKTVTLKFDRCYRCGAKMDGGENNERRQS